MSESPVPAVDAPALHIRFDDTVPIIEIPSSLAFDELRTWIREALPERAPDIGGRSCRLDFTGRELKLFDLRRLIHLLRDEFSVEITGLYIQEEEIRRYAERELKLKLFIADEPAPDAFELPLHAEATDDEHADEDDLEALDTEVYDDLAADEDEDDALGELSLPNDLDADDVEHPSPGFREVAADLAAEAPRRAAPEHGRRTFTVHRTLRSGAIVRFDGDLIVFGDVNPGAQVIATGNVVVLGALKGMAHAGAQGDESSSILAFDFRPTQVRIGKKIAMPPNVRSSVPELVVVRDDAIVIEPYKGRF